MTKKKRNVDPISIIIVCGVVLVFGIILFVVFSMAQFRVRTNLSESDKNALGNLAHDSRMAPCIERYGERDPLDIDYQIETCTFSSLNDLCSAVSDQATVDVSNEIDQVLGVTSSSDNKPSVNSYNHKIENAVINGTPKPGRDLDGKKVNIYEISYYSPNTGDGNSGVDPDSQEYYWTWTYSVLEYPDGTYRYVVNVTTC